MYKEVSMERGTLDCGKYNRIMGKTEPQGAIATRSLIDSAVVLKRGKKKNDIVSKQTVNSNEASNFTEAFNQLQSPVPQSNMKRHFKEAVKVAEAKPQMPLPPRPE